jgi:hypothetical protein
VIRFTAAIIAVSAHGSRKLPYARYQAAFAALTPGTITTRLAATAVAASADGLWRCSRSRTGTT